MDGTPSEPLITDPVTIDILISPPGRTVTHKLKNLRWLTGTGSNRMSVLCEIWFPTVSQNEFSAAFPQGNGDFPVVLADLFLNVVGMYSLSDVNVY